MSEPLPEYPSAELSVENLLLLRLNEQMQTNIELSEVVFGVPVLVDASATVLAHPERNSEITLSSSATSRREFNTQVRYNRIAMFNLFYGRLKRLKGRPTNLRQLAPQLSEISGLPFVPEDLVDIELDPDTRWPLRVDVEAHITSRTFFGLQSFVITGEDL